MCTAQDVDVLTRTMPEVTRSRIRQLTVALGFASVVVVIDQLTKRWALDRLIPGRCSDGPDNCIDLFLGLRLHLIFNPGAAFSTGAGLGPVFGVLAFVMTVVLIWIAGTRQDRLSPVLFGAIAGGAAGNLIDRITRAEDGFLSGKVVDFVDLQWWPVFNFADAAVVTGVVMLLATSVVESRAEAKLIAAQEADAEVACGSKPGSSSVPGPSTESTDDPTG